MKMNEPVGKAEVIEFKLNGETVSALAGETIIQAAKRHGVAIPHLCYKEGYRPDGNCRACVVEIKGERVLAPSCCRAPAKDMDVSSVSPRAVHSQKMVLELLKADAPESDLKPQGNELALWSARLGVGKPRFEARPQPAPDASHPAMAVNLDACIQCTRCVRACREAQVNDVIGYAHRGAHSAIVFDLADPMGESSCVGCGECVQACPTGALAPAKDAYLAPVDREVASVCPYCGVGCQITYHVHGNAIFGETGGRLLLSVADDGPGFPDHFPSHADGTRSGVGLFIAHRVARLHRRQDTNGELRLDKDARLGGARFELRLP